MLAMILLSLIFYFPDKQVCLTTSFITPILALNNTITSSGSSAFPITAQVQGTAAAPQPHIRIMRAVHRMNSVGAGLDSQSGVISTLHIGHESRQREVNRKKRSAKIIVHNVTDATSS